eukprot:4245704-Pyramimonas_sp.AAC.1
MGSHALGLDTGPKVIRPFTTGELNSPPAFSRRPKKCLRRTFDCPLSPYQAISSLENSILPPALIK